MGISMNLKFQLTDEEEKELEAFEEAQICHQLRELGFQLDPEN